MELSVIFDYILFGWLIVGTDLLREKIQTVRWLTSHEKDLGFRLVRFMLD
jgi:hypothetical protein